MKVSDLMIDLKGKVHCGADLTIVFRAPPTFYPCTVHPASDDSSPNKDCGYQFVVIGDGPAIEVAAVLSIWTFKSGRKGKVGIVPHMSPLPFNVVPKIRVAPCEVSSVPGSRRMKLAMSPLFRSIPTESVIVEFPMEAPVEPADAANLGRVVFLTADAVGEALHQAFLSPKAFVQLWSLAAEAEGRTGPAPAKKGASSQADSSVTKNASSGSTTKSKGVKAPKGAEADAELSAVDFHKKKNGTANIKTAIIEIMKGLISHGCRVVDAKGFMTDLGFRNSAVMNPGPVRLLVTLKIEPVHQDQFVTLAAADIERKCSEKKGDAYGEAVFKKLEALCGNPREWATFARGVVHSVGGDLKKDQPPKVLRTKGPLQQLNTKGPLKK